MRVYNVSSYPLETARFIILAGNHALWRMGIPVRIFFTFQQAHLAAKFIRNKQ